MLFARRAAPEPSAGTRSPGPLIRIEEVGRRFGPVAAVDGVSLSIADGEFFCLLGPSGCGKSTLLRLLAGFERPDRGRILLDGRDISDEPPHRRPLNMMFQSYALFPHLTVAGNVAYGLRRRRMARAAVAARVDEMLRLVRLEGLGGRFPAQLSGGQRQRGALARALAGRPRVLLLDEPLAALDRRLREETGAELKGLQERLGTTFVTVTHDREEAMALADRIGVMRDGRLVQVGSPREVYERPADAFVAAFLGDVNIVRGRVAGPAPGGFALGTALAKQPLAVQDGTAPAPPAGTETTLAIRPERIVVLPDGGTGPNALAGEVVRATYLGTTTTLQVRMRDGTVWRVALPGSAGAAPSGGAVRLSFPPEAAVRLG